MKQYHIPVMVSEVVSALEPASGKLFIDATLGGAGHTKELLDRDATVIGFDQDEDSIKFVSERSDIDHSRLTMINTNFDQLATELDKKGVTAVDGILFDLGVSSHQFDEPDRGFSFQSDALLDMRMSQNLAVTAKDLINGLGKKELYELFTKYGDEKLARPIAEAIVRSRQIRPIHSTQELARIIEKVYGRRNSHLHPATKVFQALRIAINDELNVLKDTLPKAADVVKPGGIIAIISFHEGEDRIVKQYFRSLEEKGWEVSKKPATPTSEEIEQNPRSRSAKLRTAKKPL